MTFFSNTDVATLESEGKDTNHFVSLIVNNAGKYTAGITRKYKCVSTTTEKFTYHTWNGEVKEGTNTFESEKEELEWFPLNITFENPEIAFEEEMKLRINEIKESKKVEEAKLPKARTGYYTDSFYDKRANLIKAGEVIPDRYTETFYKETKEDYIPMSSSDIPYGVITSDPKIVKSIVRQIITSSVIISNESSIDVSRWASSMNSLYSKRFKSLKDFEYFAESYVDFLLNYAEDRSVLSRVDEDESIAVSILSWDIRKELLQLPKNPWLDTYIKILENYIE